MKTQRERHPVTKAPHGSPAAGPVRVISADPETGVAVVRLEPAFPSDLEPGMTLAGGPGQAWVAKRDALVAETGTHDENAAAWSDDISD